MAAEQPTPVETVVEFGTTPPAPGRRRRWSMSGVVSGLGSDRRTVPLAAAVGGVALFASLISEWQTTQLNDGDAERVIGGSRPVPAGLADLGALGTGYVFGLFLLAAAVVFMLFGPPAGRRWARLAGLTAAGVQAALLGALAETLSSTTHSAVGLFAAGMPEGQVQLSYGRGIWCALVGVGTVALALWLAGRHLAPAPAAGPEAPGEPAGEDVWTWRRPRTAMDEDTPEAPIDLTVSSASPFTSRSEDRDAPA
ncbi:hypothetical protein [Actinoplanes sp. NPDC049265]|uniref:hypothetical protein n=1 Tax=Actinoplanes sp. NPDC049265 TaxID=3363902 RepID=UPI00371B120E